MPPRANPQHSRSASSLTRAPKHTNRYSPYPDTTTKPSQRRPSRHAGSHPTSTQQHLYLNNNESYQDNDQRTGGNFQYARDFAMYNPVFNDITGPDNFMKEFGEDTIPGAAFDDSARDPPPRCHPGTRLAILQRARDFLADRQADKRLLWIVGPAGVGKSAIMQSLAESMASINSDIVLGASLFFSVNGRSDGSKTLTTLAYQIAVHDSSYRHFVRNEVTNDRTLLRKALSTQFTKFIVEPFVKNTVGGGHKRFLILIDGLDECDGNGTQYQILDLISSFCIQHPTAPLVWIIASRPEPHIMAFFTHIKFASVYEKEEIVIDSDQAREDVEWYLRNELDTLGPKYPALASETQWPPEHEFLKLSAGANGLFAFAFTAVRFIDDPESGDPESRLKEILEVIDDILSRSRENGAHPMAQLDALYSRILSRVPARTLPTAKNLLLGITLSDLMFVDLCNWLALASNVAYGALHQLHSVLCIPSRDHAFKEPLRFLHKSFQDYLFDSNRSGMFQDHEGAKELDFECAQRVLSEAGDAKSPGAHGILISWDACKLPKTGEGAKVRPYLRAMHVVKSRLDTTTLPIVTHLLKLFDMRLYLMKHHNFLTELLRPGKCEERLKELGVFHELPIRKLDINNINWSSNFFECWYCSKSPVVADALSMDPSGVKRGPVRHSWRLTGDRHPLWRSWGEKDRKSRLSIFVQHFKHWQTHSPCLPISVYIDVRNWGFLFCEFADADSPDYDGEWSCCIPYCFPSAIGM
ncbi:hypothetical protein P691DRAFT_294321 [Macrolepiota fuliginosa MF-IS2]|uniref:NACHT domain-containing protein n=1 Tax=Macrolepiota fuliginosa MF-IS2 TaxID=1400762 RepID=A0A9P5XLR2_9AGAR|nr:hypothetical protein P691DRAFT_294321 [Macrolepiota fuliginosa MF-IS2]